ncbi:DUF58 domain-containing protein [Coralloluteibacterium thermophilus]|uniref:DUF58 domain-containing protein n=1 Tax=Coralloluteibacterium thermophilum TaxID=2707049 RepID=A0ABV9NNM3_9GAMM
MSRQETVPPGDGVRPDLADLIALRERVRAWPPAGRGVHGATGSSSRLRGRGMDYAESRPYAQGDDARHIDWRLTARSGRTHTKVFHAERERVSLLICDTAPALYFGTRVCFKSVQAARAGALAAWASQRSGDRIGAIRAGDEAPQPPAGGVRGAQRALDTLARWYAGPPADDRGLDEALAAGGRLLRPGGRIVVLADPASLEAVDDARLALLAEHHELCVVLLVDPLERAPPRARVALQAGDTRHVLDLAGAQAREAWRARFEAPVERACTRLQRVAAATLVLSTDAAPEAILPLLMPGRVAA